MNRYPLFLILVLVAGFSTDARGQDKADRPALRDLNGHFPFTVPSDIQQWEARAEVVRLQTKVALGLHPMPPLADPIATIHGRREMDDYWVEKVILESLPGFFVTGTLYRPAAAEQESPRLMRHPAVLYAHGHWDQGRFYEASPAAVRTLLASGAERFENAAINHMQAACVQLARMGCVVFQYDMIGYADSQQISFGRAHRYGLQGPNEPATEAGWPLFSATAEGYGQSIMGLQSINTLQAMEMLLRMPDVDPQRIAITGASGGGTQSFIASAVEPRLAGSLPAVMVSTGMQGGCVCENACGLRVGTGNIELAALTAPRPLAMTTANDWTRTMPEDGFPELVQLYELVGKPKAVELFTGAHFPHNYNHVTRVSMYGWMNRLFGLRLSEPILERDFDLLRAAELSVWDEQHPAPPSGIEFERVLCAAWAERVDAALRPEVSDDETLRAEKRQLLTQGWQSLLQWSELMRGHLASSAALTQVSGNDSPASDGEIILRLLSDGDASGSGKPSEVGRLGGVEEDGAIASVWTLSVRDPLVKAGTSDEAPLVANPRPAAAYTYGYNPPPLIRRLGVLLDALDQIDPSGSRPIRIVAEDDQIFLAAAAALQRPDAVASIHWLTASEPADDPFRNVESIRDPNFLPNSLRYQGLPGLLGLLGDRVSRVVD